jgi:hypothetical protein
MPLPARDRMWDRKGYRRWPSAFLFSQNVALAGQSSSPYLLSALYQLAGVLCAALEVSQ